MRGPRPRGMGGEVGGGTGVYEGDEEEGGGPVRPRGGAAAAAAAGATRRAGRARPMSCGALQAELRGAPPGFTHTPFILGTIPALSMGRVRPFSKSRKGTVRARSGGVVALRLFRRGFQAGRYGPVRVCPGAWETEDSRRGAAPHAGHMQRSPVSGGSLRRNPRSAFSCCRMSMRRELPRHKPPSANSAPQSGINNPPRHGRPGSCPWGRSS